MMYNATMFLRFLIVLLITFNLIKPSAIAQDVKVMNITVNDMVYVPTLDRIFITTPSGQNNGNSICKVDPYFGTIEECYFVGSEPNVLAATDDGKYLYIGLLGAPRIVRFNLMTKAIDLNITIGGEGDFLGPFYAEDIEVMPGHPDVIAVSRMNRCCSPRHEGVAIFDKGVMRSDITTDHTGSNSITFGGDILYGLNTETTEFGFRIMSINNNGVKVDHVYLSIFSHFAQSIEYADNRIYSNRGGIIDLENNTLLGTLNLQEDEPIFQASAIEVAPDSNIIFAVVSAFPFSNNNGVLLKSYNKATLNKTHEYLIKNAYPDVRKMINWGKSGRLAFITATNSSEIAEKQLVIIRNCQSLITQPLPTPDRSLGCIAFGEAVTLTAPVGFNNYTWSNGSTGREVNVRNPGEYAYTVMDSLGCQSKPSSMVKLEYEGRPSIPQIEVVGSAIICQGGVATLSISSHVDTYYTYLWSNSDTGTSIEVSSGGNYFLRTVTPGGCPSDSSNVINITALSESAPPKPIIALNEAGPFCPGDSIILSAPPGYISYNWNDGTFTSPTIIVNYPGFFSVKVTNSVGCESELSDKVQLTFNSRPGKPTIISNGNLLASSAETGNQWFLNGVPISGATGQFYQATASGFYSVQSTIDGCSSLMSELLNFFLTSVDEIETSAIVNIYPNPVTNTLTISWKDHLESPKAIEITDVTGKKVVSFSLINVTEQFDISTLSAGMYVLQIRAMDNPKIIYRQKLIKL